MTWKISRLVIDCKCMQSMEPGRWVQGKIVSAYARILKKAERKKQLDENAIVWFMPTNVSEKYFGKGYSIKCAAREKNWRKYHFSDFGKCQEMVVLIMKDGDLEARHMFMVQLDLLETLDTLFSFDINATRESKWKFAGFEMSMEKGLPQQANNYDCGVYVLKYMEALSDGNATAYEFDASAERYRFGNLLVCDDFNKGRERFFRENEDHYNKLINLDGSGEIGLFVGNKNGESPQPLLSPVKSQSDSRFSTKKVKRANMIPTVSSRTRSVNRNAIARKLQVSIGSGLGCPI